MKIHPPTRRINTFTNLAETDIVNFTPSGKINGMSDRSRHTRRKQTLSTLFQKEITSNPPRLPRALSAETDIVNTVSEGSNQQPPEAHTGTLG